MITKIRQGKSTQMEKKDGKITGKEKLKTRIIIKNSKKLKVIRLRERMYLLYSPYTRYKEKN